MGEYRYGSHSTKITGNVYHYHELLEEQSLYWYPVYNDGQYEGNDECFYIF